MQKPESVPEDKTRKIHLNFEIQTDHLNLAWGPDFVLINKNKRTCHRVDFTDHRVKLKENEKIIKYLDLAWELKKLENMKVTVIPIIAGVLGTVYIGLENRLEKLEISGKVEIIQTSA